MRTSKRLSIRMFTKELINTIQKISKECNEFAVFSCYNDKKVTVSFKRNGGKNV